MRKLTVSVTGTDSHLKWYSSYIGEQFEVYELEDGDGDRLHLSTNNYYLADDIEEGRTATAFIPKNHCQEVKT